MKQQKIQNRCLKVSINFTLKPQTFRRNDKNLRNFVPQNNGPHIIQNLVPAQKRAQNFVLHRQWRCHGDLSVKARLHLVYLGRNISTYWYERLIELSITKFKICRVTNESYNFGSNKALTISKVARIAGQISPESVELSKSRKPDTQSLCLGNQSHP